MSNPAFPSFSLGPLRPAARACAHTQGAADVALQGWQLAGLQVRLCVHPDEPRLVERYLMLGEGLRQRGLIPQWDLALQATRLLLDTASDAALPRHWRWLCVDHVHRPLAGLAECAVHTVQQQQLAALRWRLARLDMGQHADTAGDAEPTQD